MAAMGDDFEFIPQRGYCANFDTEWPHAFFTNDCIAIYYKNIAWLLWDKISIVATFRSTCWVLLLQVKSEVKPSNKRDAIYFNLLSIKRWLLVDGNAKQPGFYVDSDSYIRTSGV